MNNQNDTSFNPQEIERELKELVAKPAAPASAPASTGYYPPAAAQYNPPAYNAPSPVAAPVYTPPPAPAYNPPPAPPQYAPPPMPHVNAPNPYPQYNPTRTYPQGGAAPRTDRPPQHLKMWLWRKQDGRIGKSFTVTPEGVAFLQQTLPGLGANRLTISFIEYEKAANLFNATGQTNGAAGSGTFKVKPPSTYNR